MNETNIAIPTSERLPEYYKRVLIFVPNDVDQWKIAYLSERENNIFVIDEDIDIGFSDVSHWLPLPTAPTEAK